ncbi:MAG: hypothetical protein AAF490_20260 [Chloroflexota bacterium]
MISALLLNLIDVNEVGESVAVCDVKTAVAGQKIAETHIDDESIYLILSGQLWVEQELQILDFAQPGEFIDMLDLWEMHGSGFDIIARGDCQYMKVDNEMAELLEIHPPAFILRIMARLQADILKSN